MADDKKPLHGETPVLFPRSLEPHAAVVPMILIAAPIFVTRNDDGTYTQLVQVDERMYKSAMDFIKNPQGFYTQSEGNPVPSGRTKELPELPPPAGILPATKK